MTVPVIIIRGPMTHSHDSSFGDGGNDHPVEPEQHKSRKMDWVPTPGALDKFLAVLNPHPEEAAKQYVTLKTRLIRFFEWKGSAFPEMRADQTLDTTMRKIDEGQVVTNLMPYIMTVARTVAKEDWRDRQRLDPLDDDFADTGHPSNPNPLSKDEDEDNNRRLICFDRCLESMSSKSRNFILSYYQENGRAKIDWRKQLADQLGIPLNALRIRAHRIRRTLEQCIDGCVGQFAGTEC